MKTVSVIALLAALCSSGCFTTHYKSTTREPNGIVVERELKMSLEVRVSRHDLQIDNLISDAQQDREDRQSSEGAVSLKLEKIEEGQQHLAKIIWIGMGAIGVIQIIGVPILIAWLVGKQD